MALPRPIRTLVDFFHQILFSRDRYMLEVVSSFVTFTVGIVAAFTNGDLIERQSMTGFRDMPVPEVWVMLATIPGTVAAWHMRGRARREAGIAICTMAAFWVLSLASLICALDNWSFWTLFALCLGSAQGYAIARDTRDLRWAIAFLTAFLWSSLTLSIYSSLQGQIPIGLVAIGGWAVANLLCLRRLSVKTA